MSARRARLAPVIAIDSGNHRERFLAWRDALVQEHCHSEPDCPNCGTATCLVSPIARRVHSQLPSSFDLEDLIATGNLALLHLATRYRPFEHGGTPFSAFARKGIRGAMLNSVRRHVYEESTRPPIDESLFEDHGARIATSIDQGRLMKRLREAIAALPARQQAVVAAYYAEVLPRALRDASGGFVKIDHLACVGSALGLPEWKVIAEHSAVIEELRRKLAG